MKKKVRANRSQTASQRLLPIIEYSLNIPLDLDRMRQPAEYPKWQPVLNLVQNSRAVPLGDEAVLVMPEFVGAFELQIDEAVRRIPLDDLGGPANGEDSPAQGIADQSSLANRLRGRQ